MVGGVSPGKGGSTHLGNVFFYLSEILSYSLQDCQFSTLFKRLSKKQVPKYQLFTSLLHLLLLLFMKLSTLVMLCSFNLLVLFISDLNRNRIGCLYY